MDYSLSNFSQCMLNTSENCEARWVKGYNVGVCSQSGIDSTHLLHNSWSRLEKENRTVVLYADSFRPFLPHFFSTSPSPPLVTIVTWWLQRMHVPHHFGHADGRDFSSHRRIAHVLSTIEIILFSRCLLEIEICKCCVGIVTCSCCVQGNGVWLKSEANSCILLFRWSLML